MIRDSWGNTWAGEINLAVTSKSGVESNGAEELQRLRSPGSRPEQHLELRKRSRQEAWEGVGGGIEEEQEGVASGKNAHLIGPFVQTHRGAEFKTDRIWGQRTRGDLCPVGFVDGREEGGWQGR